jgi:hypothetical protein
MAETAEKAAEARHIPESIGARLDELPPVEAHANHSAAERRDAFVGGSRTSGAMFFAVTVLVLGALGYYGYEHRGGQDANVGPVAASAHEENQPAASDRPESTAPRANETAPANETSPANETNPANTPTSSPPSASVAAAEKSAGASEPMAAQTTVPSSADAAPQKKVRQPANVTAVAKQRPSAPSANKIGPEQYSRPAAANDASAQATQRMIERYLGTRAGVSSPRSVQ